MATQLSSDRGSAMTVELSPALAQHLEELARESGSTVDEVLRKAIALLDIAVHEKKKSGEDNLWVGPSRVVHELSGTLSGSSRVSANLAVSEAGRVDNATGTSEPVGTEITGI